MVRHAISSKGGGVREVCGFMKDEKQSLPLSSTTVKAGKSSSFLCQIASKVIIFPVGESIVVNGIQNVTDIRFTGTTTELARSNGGLKHFRWRIRCVGYGSLFMVHEFIPPEGVCQTFSTPAGRGVCNDMALRVVGTLRVAGNFGCRLIFDFYRPPSRLDFIRAVFLAVL